MVTSIKEQKLNWLFNGHPQERMGICEKYQQNVDNVSQNSQTRINYGKKALKHAQQELEKWEKIFKKQQLLMENSISSFINSEDGNIWIVDNLYVFNGFKHLSGKADFYGANPIFSEDQIPYYEKAEPILKEIDELVVILCQIKKWNMLCDYIKLDKNQNPVSARQFQKEYKMLYSKIPFIKGEYSLIYKSIYKNIMEYIEHLSPFAVREYERSANGEVITRNNILPEVRNKENLDK